MDEPTAALSGVEVERLFAVARSLRDEGRALLFISHRFDEVFALCDTVTVMRDGCYVATDADRRRRASTSSCGRWSAATSTDLFPKLPAEVGDVVLEVDGLTRAGRVPRHHVHLRAGEIVGLAGLVGAGRSEVARAVFGVDPYESGHRAPRTASRCRRAARAPRCARGLALVPEDRRKQGLVLDESVTRNITLAIRQKLAKWGLLWGGAENAPPQEWASRLEVKTAALDAETGTLSGGNQQKVVLGKWLATEPTVLIVDEPTRGIDVGTKAEVHRLLSELAQQGLAILMISSELPEVLGMADRVLVMREGRLTGEFSREEATPEAVMFAATADDGGGAVTAVDTRPVQPGSSAASALVRRIATARETGILIALLLVIVVATISNPSFLFSNDGFRDLLLTPSLLLLVAIGSAIVIITRNVDLSVGSIVGLTAYLTGRMFIDIPGIPLIGVFVGGVVLRRTARPDQRRARRIRPGARARDHARHAVHLPRHQRRVGRQRPDQRVRSAAGLPRRSAPTGSSASRSSRSSPSSCWSPPPGTCATSAPAASSTRSAPTPPPRTSTGCG